MMEYENRTLNCICGVTIDIKYTIVRGFSDYEMVICPVCNRNVGVVRADMGYEITKVIGSKGIKEE